MELPKNITQIGQSDRHCKIYVEDYVISYLKQLNFPAQDKDIAVALFGVRKSEKDITYIFFYGACKLNFLQREIRHLSQAQQQEIENARRKYFPEYEFQGYRILNGEMIEGFHICEQGICRYIEGYAQFYEKNDRMLAYMLNTRQEQAAPEEVPQEKYDMVKQRQEERKAQAEEAAGYKLRDRKVLNFRKAMPEQKIRPISAGTNPMKRMRVAIVAAFAVLCLAGLASMNNGERIENLREAAKQALDKLTEQQIPDAVPVGGGNVQVDTLVTEDKLEQALLQENAEASVPTEALEPGVSEETETQPAQPTEPAQPSSPSGEGEPVPPDTAAEPEKSSEPEETEQSEQPVQGSAVSAPVSYVIKKGDTLIAISTSRYGSDERVQEICDLNGIDDPDDIKVGEKILLP